jgi:hypothetical protein
VALLTAVTVAPATTAPVESVTLPEIVAVPSWANAGLTAGINQRLHSSKARIHGIVCRRAEF